VALLPIPAATSAAAGAAAQIEPAVRAFAEAARDVECGGHFSAGEQCRWRSRSSCMGSQYRIDIDQPGAYALFTEHAPGEFWPAMPGKPARRARVRLPSP
jgi:hypothetical protein